MYGRKGVFQSLAGLFDGTGDADDGATEAVPRGPPSLQARCARYFAAGDPPGSAAMKAALVAKAAATRVRRLRGHVECPRCGDGTSTVYVMCRQLGPGERRVCDRCLPKALAAGLGVSGTDDIDLRCHGCWNLSRPSHVMSPVPTPTVARCCERCKHELAADGWRAAVVTTHL